MRVRAAKGDLVGSSRVARLGRLTIVLGVTGAIAFSLLPGAHHRGGSGPHRVIALASASTVPTVSQALPVVAALAPETGPGGHSARHTPPPPPRMRAASAETEVRSDARASAHPDAAGAAGLASTSTASAMATALTVSSAYLLAASSASRTRGQPALG